MLNAGQPRESASEEVMSMYERRQNRAQWLLCADTLCNALALSS